MALAVPAWSADAPQQRGWSLDAQVLEVESSQGELPLRFADEQTGVSIGGSYSFTKHFALQAGYYDLDRHFVTDCPAPICTAVPHEDVADIRGVSLAAVGTWRIAPAIEIFGKLGVLASESDLQRLGLQETDRGALVGAGVGIWATERWRINVQVERTDADLELESAGVGMTYRF
jgi:hypothetical protein